MTGLTWCFDGRHYHRIRGTVDVWKVVAKTDRFDWVISRSFIIIIEKQGNRVHVPPNRATRKEHDAQGALRDIRVIKWMFPVQFRHSAFSPQSISSQCIFITKHFVTTHFSYNALFFVFVFCFFAFLSRSISSQRILVTKHFRGHAKINLAFFLMPAWCSSTNDWFCKSIGLTLRFGLCQYALCWNAVC